MSERIYMVGKTFNRLTVVKEVTGFKRTSWLCKCSCGNEKVIDGPSLRSGNTRSCGCLNKENLYSGNNGRKHGGACGYKTKEYLSWLRMKSRCYNTKHPKYKDWGGRGIKVCKRWLTSFDNFYKDMGTRPSKNHSLDRYPNNNGNYTPTNCRWATNQQQSSNRRSNVWISYKNRKMILKDWADFFNANQAALAKMLKTKSFDSSYKYYTGAKRRKTKK